MRAESRVRVHGAAKIDARAARSNGALLLSGTLKDDLGQALAGESVAIVLARPAREGAGGATEEIVRLEGEQRPTGCEDPVRDKTTAGPALTMGGGASPSLGVKVDDAGRFCVRFPLPPDRYVAHLTTHGATLLDAAKTDVTIDLAKRSVALRFDPAPRVLMIDAPSAGLDAVATVDEDAQGVTLAGRVLELRNEQGAALGHAMTNASGHAHFIVEPSKLGPPGLGELRLFYAGDTDTSAGTHAASIERHTHVRLSAPSYEGAAAAEKAQPGGVSEDGIPIEVHATLQGHGAREGDASSAPPGGSVEVRLFDQIVGAAPVERGHANVVASFVPPDTAHGSSAPLVLRYLPDAPWYEPGEPLTIHVALRGPSPLRQLPLALAGLAVMAFLAFGRFGRRAARTSPAREVKPLPAGTPEARIEVVRPAPAGHGHTWTGRVIDAHRGAPLAQVRVVIEHATFGQRELAASATTDALGVFRLEAPHVGQDPRLVAEGPFHTAHRQKLPPAGEILIALVSRKRALLDRLIAWARMRGRPFDQRPEPTPGHVRNAAGADFGTAHWAEEVERAVFSAEDIDARAEEDIEKLAPIPASVGKARPAKMDVPSAQQTQVNAAASPPRSHRRT
ncbi:hypothetical protein [Pendulispora albinea]|uniref:Carboxypeptidase regulatory-like domain-containing protein n=1 Tax=Pendulispora albinea TaxID=2741071 RepID=A0ABZ2M4T4_9BACT